MSYAFENVLALLSRPLSVVETALKQDDPTMGDPTATAPWTLLELSHRLILSPYAGQRFRMPTPRLDRPVVEPWYLRLTNPSGDPARLRAVKYRPNDAVPVTLDDARPFPRRQLVDMTTSVSDPTRSIVAEDLRLSASGASGRLIYNRTPPLSGESLVLWDKTLARGRDVVEKVAYQGFLWPWMLDATLVKTSRRVFLRTTAGDVATLLTDFEVTLRDIETDLAPPADQPKSLPWTHVALPAGFRRTGTIRPVDVPDDDGRPLVVQAAKPNSQGQRISDTVKLICVAGTTVEYRFPFTLTDGAGQKQSVPHCAIFVPDFSGEGDPENGNDPASFRHAFARLKAYWRATPQAAPLHPAYASGAPVAPGDLRDVPGSVLRCVRGGVTAGVAPGGARYFADGGVLWQKVGRSLADLFIADATVAFADAAQNAAEDIARVSLPTLSARLAVETAIDDLGRQIATSHALAEASVTLASMRDLGQNAYAAVSLIDDYKKNGFANRGQVYAELLDVASAETRLQATQLAERALLAFPSADPAGLSRSLGTVFSAGSEASAKAALEQALGGIFNPATIFDSVDATLLGFIPLKTVLKTVNFVQDGLDKAAVLERTVHDLTGSRVIVASYRYENDLQADQMFLVQGHLSIVATVTTTVSLTGAPPKVETALDIVLTDVVLRLFELADVRFQRLAFHSGTGVRTSFEASAGSPAVRLSGQLNYLDQLASGLGLGGWTIRQSDLGLLASFDVALPPVPCGIFSIDALRFSSGLDMPFDGRSMEFAFGFASPFRPFALQVGLFRGGGYVAMRVTPLPPRLQLEAALEFGGGFALDLGVASGSVYLVGGVRIAVDSNGDTSLTGYVRCGGCIEVLGIISISIEFYLGLTAGTHDGAWYAEGVCELIVEISILFFSASVHLRMERQFAGSPPSAPLGQTARFSRAIAAPNPIPRRFSDYVDEPRFLAYLDRFEVH